MVSNANYFDKIDSQDIINKVGDNSLLSPKSANSHSNGSQNAGN